MQTKHILSKIFRSSYIYLILVLVFTFLSGYGIYYYSNGKFHLGENDFQVPYYETKENITKHIKDINVNLDNPSLDFRKRKELITQKQILEKLENNYVENNDLIKSNPIFMNKTRYDYISSSVLFTIIILFIIILSTNFLVFTSDFGKEKAYRMLYYNRKLIYKKLLISFIFSIIFSTIFIIVNLLFSLTMIVSGNYLVFIYNNYVAVISFIKYIFLYYIPYTFFIYLMLFLIISTISIYLLSPVRSQLLSTFIFIVILALLIAIPSLKQGFLLQSYQRTNNLSYLSSIGIKISSLITISLLFISSIFVFFKRSLN